MAERSSCVKVITECQTCSRQIKRYNCSEDNYCDDCEERVIGTINLCDSSRKACDVKEIDVLSGLVKDRKNKFLFVGEGNFSFTVAFNAYRKSLLSQGSSLDRFKLLNKDYYPCSMVMMLIFLLQSTDEAVERTCELLKEHRQIAFVLKSVSNTVKCLKVACSENQRANRYLDNSKPCLAINPLAVVHILRSLRVLNRAKEYLLKSIHKMEMVVPANADKGMRKMEGAGKRLRVWISKVKKALANLSDHGFKQYYGDIIPYGFIEEPIKKDITQHIKSLITVDDMVQDMKYFYTCPRIDTCIPIAATRPPIDIISSRYEGVPYERTISEVRDAMCSGSGGYMYPSEDIVRELRDVDCTNIRQMCGIDARSIPPEMARWSNLVWFQCPWTEWHAIPDLIRAFLRSASDNCAPGTFVCVGITTRPDYMHRYCLERILGDNLDSCTLNHRYIFLGVDDVLIKKLLSYGYKHESESCHDIHNYIRTYHVTLVFKLRSDIRNDYTRTHSKLISKYERRHRPY